MYRPAVATYRAQYFLYSSSKKRRKACLCSRRSGRQTQTSASESRQKRLDESLWPDPSIFCLAPNIIEPFDGLCKTAVAIINSNLMHLRTVLVGQTKTLPVRSTVYCTVLYCTVLYCGCFELMDTRPQYHDNAFCSSDQRHSFQQSNRIIVCGNKLSTQWRRLCCIAEGG